VVLQTGAACVRRDRVSHLCSVNLEVCERGVSIKEREDVTKSTCGCVGNCT
jgi:hypothetical protein